MKDKRKDTFLGDHHQPGPAVIINPAAVPAPRQAWSQAIGPKVRIKERTPKQATRPPAKGQAVKHRPGQKWIYKHILPHSHYFHPLNTV
jgi:hypothetical protein